MLPCKISPVSIKNTCELDIAGVRRLAFANWGDYSFVASSGCTVDTIDLGSEKAFEVQVLENTGSMEASLQVGNSPDQKYILHSVSGTMSKLDCELLNEYVHLVLAKVIIFVQTKNGDVYALGVDNGLQASTFSYTTGAGEGDQHGVAFTFDGAQPNPPLKIKDWKTVSDLFPSN